MVVHPAGAPSLWKGACGESFGCDAQVVVVVPRGANLLVGVAAVVGGVVSGGDAGPASVATVMAVDATISGTRTGWS